MWRMYNEKVFYKDAHVKVADYITVPFTAFVLLLILIPTVCYFFDCPLGWLGIVFLPVIFIWLRMVYKTYTELKVSTGTGNVKLR